MILLRNHQRRKSEVSPEKRKKSGVSLCLEVYLFIYVSNFGSKFTKLSAASRIFESVFDVGRNGQICIIQQCTLYLLAP